MVGSVLPNRNIRKRISDVKTTTGEECVIQNELPVMDVKLAKAVYSKSTSKKRMTLRRLKDKNINKGMEKEMEHSRLHQVKT